MAAHTNTHFTHAKGTKATYRACEPDLTAFSEPAKSIKFNVEERTTVGRWVRLLTHKIAKTHTHRHTNRQTQQNGNTYRKTDRQTDRQMDGQTDRQTDQHKGRETDTGRPTNTPKTQDE